MQGAPLPRTPESDTAPLRRIGGNRSGAQQTLAGRSI